MGEKWTKQSILPPDIAMWGPNIVLLIIGLYFLNKARNDSDLFEFGWFTRLTNKIKAAFKKQKATA